MGNNKRDLKGKTYEEIYGKSKADFIKNKQRNGLRKNGKWNNFSKRGDVTQISKR